MRSLRRGTLPGLVVMLGISLVASPVTVPVAHADVGATRDASAAGAENAGAKKKKGKLLVAVEGLTDPVKSVTVKGPKKFTKTLSQTATLKRLKPGKYRVSAKKSIRTEFTTYKPIRRKQTIRVKAGKQATVTVTFKDIEETGVGPEEPVITGPPAIAPNPPATPAPLPPVPPTAAAPTTPAPSTPPGPTQPPEPPRNPVKALTGGTAHTCAIDSTGRAYCWGDNQYGQLGDGTTNDSSAPRRVQGLASAIAIDAGTGHTCAVESYGGYAKCWGINTDGQLGNGRITTRRDPADSTTPVSVVDGQDRPLGALTSIAVGVNHSCALQDDGTAKRVWCWGANTRGQLGTGKLGSDEARAVVATEVDTTPVELGAGDAYSCARLGSGNLECWGNNDNGQLGNKVGGQSANAVAVDLSARKALSLAVGFQHACAQLAGGGTTCWGNNDEGQLNGAAGQPNDTRSTAPVSVTVGDATSLRPGEFHTCALLTGGTVACWGGNFAGELGIGTTDDAAGINAVRSLTGVRVLASGDNHSCAGTSDGKVYCWGANDDGQVGPGPDTDVTAPREVALP